jgi:hypothetical protein
VEDPVGETITAYSSKNWPGPGTRFVAGHMRMDDSLYRLLPRSYAHITILRDPIDRFISDYYYAVKGATGPVHELTQSRRLTLKEFVNSGLGRSNDQVKRLAGVNRLFVWGSCTEENLRTAKKNLVEKISFFGLLERFDEMLVGLRRLLGWEEIYYVRKNTGRARPPRESMSPEDLEYVAEYNRYDMELYEYAKSIFEERISRWGEPFRQELEQFRSRNAEYQQSQQVVDK